MTAISAARTLAIVDIDNLLMGTNLAGIEPPVLADQLWAQLEARCGGKKIEVRAYASEHTRGVSTLATAFSARGYDFRVCEALSEDKRKSSVDPHMMVDTLVTMLEKGEVPWTTVALVTGDTDFAPLLQHVRQHGVETLVLTPAHHIPRALKAAATESQPLWDPEPAICEPTLVPEFPSVEGDSVPLGGATLAQSAPQQSHVIASAGPSPSIATQEKAEQLIAECVRELAGRGSLAGPQPRKSASQIIVAAAPAPVRARETAPDDVWRLIGGPLTRAGVQFPSLGSLELGDALAEVADVSNDPGKYPAKALANRLKARNLGAGAEATTLLTLCSFGHQVLKTRPGADPADVRMCFVEGVLAIARGIGGIDTSMRSRDALLRWVLPERSNLTAAVPAGSKAGPATS